MRLNRSRAGHAAVSAVVAAALTTALPLPATAQTPTEPPPTTAPGRLGQADPHSLEIPLITGDRVLYHPAGRVTGLIRAKGRENVPVQILDNGSSVEVVPADVRPLINSGVLDERLFNVTELSRPEYRDRDGLPIIVTYRENRSARLRAGDGVDVHAALDSINGEALTVDADKAADVWTRLARPTGALRSLDVAPGIRSIALDGIVEAALDESVSQIGAPAAWAAGYDGSGVKLAVLDSGVDTDHPDFAGRIGAAVNFTDAADAEDHNGHGTHVASTAAGTGAASDGRYRGVAPGVELLSGKVLDDRGSGFDSGIIAGMQWAVDQGADVVSMSLGQYVGANVDLKEAALEQLSATSDTLFVVAAGNAGPNDGILGSPGTADAALTVGAVDGADRLAPFSSRGPRVRDGGIKPDVTAPGVDITAALPGGGYGTMSGTSMATPHVSGAAALLAQARPDWTGQQLKSVLVSSARPGGHTPYQQGSGRIDVAAALRQTVVAETGSVNFGAVSAPDDNVPPVTREIRYRNLGDRDVTLDLAVTGDNPAGMFSLNADRVTVPAGGTATVQVTADSRAGGDRYGSYGVYVVGTGDGQTVTTAGVLRREPPVVTLTMKAVDRTGAPATNWNATVYDMNNLRVYYPDMHDDGTATAELPVGDYRIEAFLRWQPDGTETGDDWLVMPSFDLTEQNTSVTFEANDARPVRLTPPDKKAKQAGITVGMLWTRPEDGFRYLNQWMGGPSPDGFRTGQLGHAPDSWDITGLAITDWQRGNVEYHLSDRRDGSFYTGLNRQTPQKKLALIRTRLGAWLPDRTGWLFTGPTLLGSSQATAQPLPRAVDVYVETGVTAWGLSLMQNGPDGVEAYYSGENVNFEAGRTYQQDLNIGVFGPYLREGNGVLRRGDQMGGILNPTTDGAGNYGDSLVTSAQTVLYRDGKEYATADTHLDLVVFDVPAERARYKLVSTIHRDAPVSSEISMAYTFTSARPAGEETVTLNGTVVRFTPKLGLDSTAPAHRRFSVPVAVQGPGAEDVAELTVSVSTDGGRSWREARLKHGEITVKNPGRGGGVSLRAEVVGRDGTTLTQTIINAYRTA
ncbi:S8 family serine peptidase [Plantactinospora sp. B24E8]|uniref:S8 family peptidase n=1 Tax=Plantactinospora sp. B24E8 TaxID=3153567 RepID=UPI00325D81FD